MAPAKKHVQNEKFQFGEVMTDILKYEKEAAAAFTRLGFDPRPGQVEAVCRVLSSYLDDKMESVVLCAPTGTGKSLIGAATAEALTVIQGRGTDSGKSSISLVSTNALGRQYYDTFGKLSKLGKFIIMKGANNYDCSALSTPSEPQTAETCAWYAMVQRPQDFSDILENHCAHCAFLENKLKKNTIRHLTTNYSYYFVDRMYTGKFEDRDLLIWDEAHLINDLFAEHNTIFFSQKRMKAYHKEIAETINLTDLKIAKTLTAIEADLGKKGKINEKNYETYLNALATVYTYAKDQGAAAADKALKSNNHSAYSRYTRFSKKYEGLCCKIGDMFKYNYPRVFDYDEKEFSVSIKPIFVNTMFGQLRTAQHNLFMSATISKEYMVTTLGLDPNKTAFIKLEPTFPKEHKELVFFDPLSLSYTSLKDPKVVKQLCSNVAKIVKKHVEDGENGIILTPSFYLQEQITNYLTDQPIFKKYKLFDQRRGEKLDDVLTAFKQHKGSPAVLASPSLFEGLDLPQDLSRFQIMVKAPYQSLGDKRIKYIMDHYKSIFEWTTLVKIIQGAGRSVRSADDYAVTYLLDRNIQWLWNSKQNIWTNEFNVRFTKFI